MLFNSLQFIAVFLPVTWCLYFACARFVGSSAALAALSLASMFFYAWWNPVYLLLILAEVVFCFGVGRLLLSATLSPTLRRLIVTLAVGLILMVLGYFKYTNFLLSTFAAMNGSAFSPLNIILPLGISFHSFQQIAYLVDAYRGRAGRYDFIRYCLFVTFFPQLIAGPIVHHHELLPQLGQAIRMSPKAINVAVGLGIFAVGLFKKTIIADGLGQVATPIFDAVAAGQQITMLEAWCGALAYTLQLYFDFSAYSDMAIGLARLFNLRLPINFYSPYKATNIADFWRRWHITLSRFFRDYLYIPLGGNRHGIARRCANLMVTMLLGGLWHGAGWTFVIWGGAHGIMLLVHSLWSTYVKLPFKRGRLYGLACWFVTFICVTFAWVLFRSVDINAAWQMIATMTSLNDAPLSLQMENFKNLPFKGWRLIGVALLLAVVAPNTAQLFRRYHPALRSDQFVRPSGASSKGKILKFLVSGLEWRPILWKNLTIGLVFGMAIVAIFGWQSEFLYFQF